MKIVTNVSLQARTILLNTESGTRRTTLLPGQSLTIEDNYSTPRLRILLDRKLVEIKSV